MKDDAGTFKGVRAAAGAGIQRNGSDERPEDGTPRWKDHEPAMQILDEIIDAHGGMDLWSSIDELDVVLSSQGFLFTSLMRWRAPVVKRKQVRLLTREPRLTLFDLPESGLRSELIGNDEVRIVDGNGTTVAQRMNPRATFRGLARRLTWDALDFTYFAGYALWNYLTTPLLLVYKDVHVGALDPLDGLSRLRVTFPDEIPTHSRRQIFYFDNRRRLRRLDYAVDIVSRRVRCAHFCDEYETFDGLAAPTRRRVLPLLIDNAPLPGPTLVAIDIHSIEWRAR